jgi:polygalacturonase
MKYPYHKSLGFILIVFALFIGSKSYSFAQNIQVQCNKQTIEVTEQNDMPLSMELNSYKIARLSYHGNPLSIRVKALDFDFDDNEWDISPHSYGIKGHKKDNELTFEINRTGYLVLRFSKDQNFKKRLVILIEAPEVLPKGQIVDIVKTYGIDNSGLKNETLKIQKALEDISGTNKVLFFPKGTYKTFNLSIKSNSHIHLAKNARIIADASKIEPYFAREGEKTDHFILIKDAENVKITGLGTLDGNGSEILARTDPNLIGKSNGIRLLFMLNSKNIQLEGILLKDSARWNTHIMGSEDVTFRNCKILNSLINNEVAGSFDGWDPDASRRILIENCFAWTGDDNVAIKCTEVGSQSSPNTVEAITVRNCVFLTKKSAMKIGTETFGSSMKQILFENNDIIEADRVIGINVRDRATVDGVIFRNNRSECNYPDRLSRAINIYLVKRDKIQTYTGKIKNVLIEDCSFEQMFPNKMEVSRHKTFTSEGDIELKIRNLTIDKQVVKSVDATYFNLDKSNGTIVFE